MEREGRGEVLGTELDQTVLHAFVTTSGRILVSYGTKQNKANKLKSGTKLVVLLIPKSKNRFFMGRTHFNSRWNGSNSACLKSTSTRSLRSQLIWKQDLGRCE